MLQGLLIRLNIHMGMQAICRGFVNKMILLEIKVNREGPRCYKGCQLDCWTARYFTTSTLSFVLYVAFVIPAQRYSILDDVEA